MTPTFVPAPVEFARGGPSHAIGAADLNADGRPDLVVGVDASSSAIAVLLNAGDGTFQPASVYPYPQRDVLMTFGLAFGDFDGDGDPDLATAFDKGVGLFVNDGTGKLVASSPFAVQRLTYYPGALVAADFNADSKPDLAVTGASVLLNSGDGAFEAPLLLDSGHGLAAGDVTGDGLVDLVIAGGSLLVYANRGGGVFAEVDRHPGHEGGLTGAALADLDGDGDRDAVSGDQLRDVVEVFWNQGDGTFSAPLELPAGGRPWAIQVGDLDNDGRADLVATVLQSSGSGTTASITVFTNLENQAFAPSYGQPSFDVPAEIALADFNNDGRLDIATGNQSPKNTSIWLNSTER